jgi:protein-disulfide isomerase
MKNLPLLIGTILVTVLLVVGVAVFASGPSADQPVDPVKVVGDGRHSKGAQNPKVTIVEFSDFQCPFCRQAYKLGDELIKKYPNDVKFIYRQFPVTGHQYAPISAQAGEAAGTFGKFWEMHDLLFETQNEWSTLRTEGEVRQKLTEYAEKLQIDKNEFQKRIDSSEVREKLLKDRQDGDSFNFRGTPTFYVNGQPYSAQELTPAVEALLNTSTQSK